jgi:hypothetical protein
VFIGKPSPKPAALSQSQALILVGTNIEPPNLSELKPNTNDDAVEATLSNLLGISPNLHTPPEGQSRDPLQANVSHTKFYLFQEQGLVANRDMLFYRQAEPFLPQAMKDTLPYLLGAIDDDRVMRLRELRELRQKIRMLERDVVEAEASAGGGTALGQALLAEASQVGLISTVPNVRTAEEIRDRLSSLTDWTPTILPEAGVQRAGGLREEIQVLRRELRAASEAIEAARSAAGYATSYQEEIAHQKARLESIEVFKDQGDSYLCPFCGAKPDIAPPAVTELNERLREHLFEYVEGDGSCLLFHYCSRLSPPRIVARCISEIVPRPCEMTEPPIGEGLVHCSDVCSLRQTGVNEEVAVVADFLGCVTIDLDSRDKTFGWFVLDGEDESADQL